MITESIQEDITIVNVYAPNIGAPQYIRQTLTGIRGEIDSNTIIVGDFNTPLTPGHPLLSRACLHLSQLPEPSLSVTGLVCICFSSPGSPLCHGDSVDLFQLPGLASALWGLCALVSSHHLPSLSWG